MLSKLKTSVFNPILKLIRLIPVSTRIDPPKKQFFPYSLNRSKSEFYFDREHLNILIKVRLFFSFIFLLACSSRPASPVTQKSVPPKLASKVLMGPPSLLALTEGTIDHQEDPSNEKELSPQLSLVKSLAPKPLSSFGLRQECYMKTRLN